MEKVAGNNHYLNSEFVHVNSRECTLLLEFNESGYSYSILQNKTNELLYSGVSSTFLDFFNITEKQLIEIFKNDILFNYAFENVFVLIHNFYSTLVPVAFYNKDKNKELISFNSELPSKELVYLSDKVPKIDYFNIYVSTINLNKILKDIFINFHIKSTKSILLDYASKVTQKGEFLQLHISNNFIFCVYFNKGKLEFSNSFRYNNEEDIIFNVLNIYNQLGLNNERTVLHISGNITKKDKKYDLFYTYIRNIEFLRKPIKINYSQRVKLIPDQYFVHHYVALL